MAATDLSYGVENFARSLLLQNTGSARTVLLVGDSKMQEDCTANAGASPGLHYGLVLGADWPIIGTSVRSISGPAAWLGSVGLQGYNNHGERSAGATDTGPDALYDGTTILMRPPVAMQDFRFTANVDNFNKYWSALLNATALAKITTGDFSLGNLLTARVIIRSIANGLPNGYIEGYRGAALQESLLWDHTAAAVAAGGPAITYKEVSCGSAAGVPEVKLRPRIQGADDYDETGKDAQIITPIFYRPNTAGLIICSIANGGWKNNDFYTELHGTDLGLQAYLASLPGGGPTHMISKMGTNLSSTEATELNAGTVTTWKASSKARIDRIKAACIANGKPLQYSLEISPDQTAYTDTNRQALCQGSSQLAREESNVAFMDLYNNMSKTVAYYCGADNVHLSEAGAVMMGSIVGAWINAAAAAGARGGGIVRMGL